MCGILACITTKDKADAFVSNALAKLEHRGQDSVHVHRSGGVTMAHRRLAITGNGIQPIVSEQTGLACIVNGEFYDYKEVRQRITADDDDYVFKTESDSEIILPLYRRHGLSPKFFEQLNGEFSFAILDEKNNKLVVCRDRFGVKPLYFHKSLNEIYIASEIKAFHGFIPLKFDEKTLYTVLSMQYHDTFNTLFDGVKQVEPGTFLVIDTRTLSTEAHTYWDITASASAGGQPENELIDEFRTSLTDSVARRLDTTQPLAISLSGGVDSSVILAIASQLRKQPIDCYSISFKNAGSYDEIRDAAEMAAMWGANLHSVEVSTPLLLDHMEIATYHGEQVSMNSHLPAKYLMFQEMRKNGIRVSLSGEGADEQLFGYSHLLMDLNQEHEAPAYLAGLHVPDANSLPLDRVNQILGFAPSFIKAKFSMGWKIHNFLLSDQYKRAFESFDVTTRSIGRYPLPDATSRINASAYLWSKLCLSNSILNTLGDKMEMAHTIEGRVPFLDARLTKLVERLPLEMKINNGVEKYILKEAFKDKVTQKIYRKKKHPFLAPPLFDCDNEYVYNFVMDIVSSDLIKSSHFFDATKIARYIGSMRKSNVSVKASADPVIMMLLSIYFLQKRFT
jgi:asparagine synthase (glutamine-hydrolysing)